MKVNELVKLLQSCPQDYEVNISVDVSSDLDKEDELRAFGTEILEAMREDKAKIITLITTGNINFEELLK
jgi:hypothetical protein